MEAQIIEYLQERSEFVPTLDIAKKCCGSKGTKKDVNPTLYKLEREKIVKKTAEENGRNPRWKLCE